MSREIIIRTQNLGKIFRDPVEFHALKKINLEIYRGEFSAITGASGSGKSTLLYVLSTLDTDYTGKLFFEEEDLSQKSKNGLAELRNQKIGFVFQFHYLLHDFTVIENVMLPGLKLGLLSESQLRKKALEKLEILGLPDQAEKKAGKLSGGQQQRVAIARAMINDPVIIFGDEPTGNLDSVNTKNVFDVFKSLKEQFNQTILVVTHDQEFAGKTDRIIKLHDGEVVKD
jgi:lipoprotein-releasing system ATP-binding protein